MTAEQRWRRLEAVADDVRATGPRRLRAELELLSVEAAAALEDRARARREAWRATMRRRALVRRALVVVVAAAVILAALFVALAAGGPLGSFAGP